MSFVRLDFITVKSQFNIKTLLVFTVALLPLMALLGDSMMGIGMGVMLAMVFMGYPFMIGEKSGMDAFYATLSLRRETVVAGRYLFVLALNIGAVLFTLVLILLSLLVVGITDMFLIRETMPSSVEGMILAYAPLIAVFVITQVVQLPLLFKFGYAKARFLILIPVVVLVAAGIAVSMVIFTSDLPGGAFTLVTLLTSNGPLFALLSLVILALLVFASYRLSLSFYRKREF
jgi:hypothetical protein